MLLDILQVLPREAINKFERSSFESNSQSMTLLGIEMHAPILRPFDQ